MSAPWYRKIGFYHNPFSIKPAAFGDELVAYDLSYIYKKIEKSEMVFIEGEYGTGKTTILKNIIGRFRGKNKIIYYNFDQGQDFDARELIDGANSFLRRISGLGVKDIIMLLDEVQSMKPKDAKQVLSHYKEGSLKSVVFVSHDYGIVNLPEEFKPLLNGNIIRTVNLSSKEAVALVRRRIGSIELLSDKIIAKLFTMADRNPRRLLGYCEDVARFAVEMGDTRVTDFHIEEVLGKVIRKKQKTMKKSIVREKPKIAITQEDSATIVNVPVKEEAKEEFKEIKAIEQETSQESEILAIDASDVKKDRKFKINRLVDSSKRDTLGMISEKEPESEEIPEYKVYFLDNE